MFALMSQSHVRKRIDVMTFRTMVSFARIRPSMFPFSVKELPSLESVHRELPSLERNELLLSANTWTEAQTLLQSFGTSKVHPSTHALPANAQVNEVTSY